ncbi:MAG: hypothetical protein HGA85_06800 [Nanoarchaeota archaeon]|nr:hypothetical protein [Nanoarchaeota archaeon]
MNKKQLLLLAALCMLSILSAADASDLLSLQGTVNFTGTGNISVAIWDNSVGGNLIYDSGTDFNGAVQNGRYDILLGSGASTLNLYYGRAYYLDLSINSQDLDFGGNERQQFQSSVGKVIGTYINDSTISSLQILDGSISSIDIANDSIEKEKILTTGTWLESEIPSLTALWPGSLNASRIVSQLLLNVNHSLAADGLSQGSYNYQSGSVIVNANYSATAGTALSYAESDPQIGITAFSSWCVGNGTGINCNASAPAGSVDTSIGVDDTALYNNSNAVTLNLTWAALNLNVNRSSIANNLKSGNYNYQSGLIIVNANYSVTSGATTSDTAWASHDDYPAACGAGEYVTAVGDTLTCSTPAGGGTSAPGTAKTNQIWQNEFCTLNLYQQQDFFGVAISSGTITSQTGDQFHPCVLALQDSTTANGGYIIGLHTAANQALLQINGSEVGTFIFQPKTATTVWTVRMGFLDTLTVTAPVDGCFFESVDNANIVGACRANNAQTNTSTRFTGSANLSVSNWYKGIIEVNADASSVSFRIYNSTNGNTALLWSDTVASNIPTASGRQTSFGVIATQSTVAAAQQLLWMDYMELYINRTLAR